MYWLKKHPDFKLNGRDYSLTELEDLGKKHLTSEIESERDFGQLMLDWINDSAYMTVHTSGTTGTPKLIQIEKRQMINSAQATADFFELKPKDKALLCMPTKYIGGKMMWVRAWVCGWHLDVVPPTSTPLLSTDSCYDFTAMVPLQVEESWQLFHRIKKIIIGGAKLDDTLREKLLTVPTICYETYGMTETITHIAAKKIEENHFTALPNVAFSLDPRDCLIIEAPKVNEQTVITNDIVRLIDAQHFEWLGRLDNVINSGGVKVYPEKIENLLSPLINRRFFIAGLTDSRLGQKVVLVIEGKPYPLTKNNFEALHPYERPKEIFFVDQFAETPTGKIKRNEILMQLQQ